MKWKTQTGQEIEISDMSDSHIQNTIMMLKRKKYHRSERIWVPIRPALNFLGDGPGEDTIARMHYDEIIDDVLTNDGMYITRPAHPAYQVLLRERNKRRKQK